MSDKVIVWGVNHVSEGSDGDRSNRAYKAGTWVGQRIEPSEVGRAVEAMTMAAATTGGGSMRSHIARGIAWGQANRVPDRPPTERPPPRARAPIAPVTVAQRVAVGARRMPAPGAEPPPVYETAAAFLARKRIDPGVVALAGIEDRGDRLAYPVATLDGVRLGRLRILTVPKASPRWEGEPGAVEACYGAGWHPGHVVYWTNGESSVWTAASVGVAAMCGCTGERLPTDRVLTAAAGMAVTLRIALDVDDVGRRATEAILQRARSLGLHNVEAVALPDSLGRGGDLGDFCLRHGARAYYELDEVASWR
jgi:hypothetical protein